MTQEVRSEDIKVGETYGHRFDSRKPRNPVVVVRLHFGLGNRSHILQRVIVRHVGEAREFPVYPTTLETIG